MKEKTLNRINRENKLMGLSLIELIFIVPFPVMSMLTNIWFGIITGVVAFIVGRKLSKEAKRGCPDYFQELTNHLSVKTKFEDQNGIIEKLTNEHNSN